MIMDHKRESPVAGGGPGLEMQIAKRDCTARPRKWQRVLAALVSGRSLNRFEAERQLHDHCLHTTVSFLQGKGVTIHRADETVSGYQGAPTHVMRYRLAEDSRQRAAELLDQQEVSTA